jgi:hypothetical protein
VQTARNHQRIARAEIAFWRFVCAGVLLIACAEKVPAQNSTIETLTGPVTPGEISSFKSAIAGLVPGDSNNGNNYAYGNGGDAMEACADMYDITKDRSILDKLVLYCDKVVSIRNTNRVMWTGKIDPVWPNSSTTTIWGCEQGDVVGHLAYCAQLIAENVSLWDTPVTIGDTNGYGATYKARAQTYLAVVDQTLDLFYTNNFIHSDGYMQTPPDPPWPDPNSAGDAVPWNQQNMICGGLIRGADVHSRFGDASPRIAQYRTTATVSITRFFTQCNNFRYLTNGDVVCKWSYSGGNFAPGAPIRYTEDTAHGGYDITAVHRAAHWLPGMPVQYTNALMVANTLMDVIRTNTQFWSRVDGTGSLSSGMKNSWTYLCEWRADAFAATTKTGSQYYADAARKLWIKNALLNGWPASISLGLNLPPPWLDVDVGNPGVTGNATFTNGVFTLQGSGTDIGSTSDQFNYTHQPVLSDFTFSGRVASQSNTGGAAKSGLVARAGRDAGSPFVGAFVTPGSGLLVLYRSSTNSAVATLTNVPGVTAPCYLQLVRQSNSFAASYSADGTNWNALGNVSIPMVGAVVGFGVTAHNNSVLGTSTFDNANLSAVGFSLNVDSPSLSVFPNSNVTCNVTINPLNGFNGNVALSLTGLPAKTSASFSPASINPSQSSVLTITASNSVIAGNYTLTLSGVNGGLNITTPILLTVNQPPPSTDTHLICSDNTWVRRSENTTVEDSSETLQNKRLNDSNTRLSYVRFNIGYFLAHHSIPGITAAKLQLYIPTATSGAGTLSVYGLLDNVGGTNGFDALWSSTSMTWNNQPAKTASPNDIPSSTSALPNTNTTALLGSIAVPGTAGELDVSLDLSVLTNLLSNDSNQQITFLFVNNSATQINFASFANSGGYLQPTLELVAPVTDFSLGLSPSAQTIATGSNAVYTVTITGSNNFTGNIGLSTGDLPAGMTAVFNPPIITNSGTATLTLSTTADVLPDIYVVPISASTGALEHDSSLTLTVVSGDSDGDGIPDGWMQQYFGHPTGQAADNSRASDDADGDGMSNLAEYLCRTDPTDPTSYLHVLTVQAQGPDESVSWAAVGGVSYVVQSSTNLTAGFHDISPVITPDSDGPASYADTGAVTNSPLHYYRIRLGP